MHNQLTSDNMKKLQEELEYRMTVKRAEIAKEKLVAAAHGDRSENAEYKEACRNYRENDNRIQYLLSMISTATIIDEDEVDKSVLGVNSKAKIRFVEEETGEVQQSTNASYFNPTNSGVGNNNFNVISPPVINQPKPSSGDSSKLKSVLYITVESKDLDTMMNRYNFNEAQRKQVAELLDPKYDDLWMQLLYGTAGGDFVYWRQKNAPWSNIKIGNSNGTIGSIGCLVTSISILIEKSGVNDTIIPFNPGTFVEALNKNGAFDSDGNLSYAPITKVVPRFEYVGRVELAGKTKQ